MMNRGSRNGTVLLLLGPLLPLLCAFLCAGAEEDLPPSYLSALQESAPPPWIRSLLISGTRRFLCTESFHERGRGRRLLLYFNEFSAPILIKALEHPSWIIRREALSTLGDFRAPSLSPHFAAAVHDPNWAVREKAYTLLGLYNPPGAVKVLSEGLKDPVWRNRKAVVKALRIIGGEDTLDPLLAAFGDGDEEVHLEVLDALSRLSDPRATEAFIRGFKEASPKQKRLLLPLLFERERESLESLFLHNLNDPDPTISIPSAFPLLKTHRREILKRNHFLQTLAESLFLPAQVEMTLPYSPSPARIATLLGKAFAPFLLRRLEEDPHPSLFRLLVTIWDDEAPARLALLLKEKDWNPEMYGNALLELARLQGDAALPLLEREYFSALTPMLQRKILEALKGLGGKACTRILLDSLESPDAKVRSEAYERLGEIMDPSTLRLVERALLREENASDLVRVLHHLEEFLGRTDVSFFFQFIRERNESVSEKALNILFRFRENIPPSHLFQVLQDILQGKYPARIKSSVLSILATVGGKQAEEILKGYALNRSAPVALRETSIKRLPALMGSASLPILESVIQENKIPSLTQEALLALQRIPGSEASEILIHSLSQEDEGLRLKALEALQGRDLPRVRRALLGLLQEPPAGEEFQRILLRTAASLKNGIFAPALLAVLRDRGKENLHRDAYAGLLETAQPHHIDEILVLVNQRMEGELKREKERQNPKETDLFHEEAGLIPFMLRTLGGFSDTRIPPFLARSLFKREIALFPKKVATYSWEQAAVKSLGQYPEEEILPLLKKEVDTLVRKGDLFATSGTLHRILGDAFKAESFFSLAYVEYDLSLKLGPSFSLDACLASKGLGTLEEKRENYAKASACYALSAFILEAGGYSLPEAGEPGTSFPLTVLKGISIAMKGLEDLKRNRVEEGLSLLRKAAALEPRDSGLKSLIAWYLAERNLELDWALSLAEEAYRLSPHTPHIIDTLGWVSYRRGNPSRSTPLFKEALRYCTLPGERENLYTYHLALSLLREGEREEGLKLLVRIFRLPERTISFIQKDPEILELLDPATLDELKEAAAPRKGKKEK